MRYFAVEFPVAVYVFVLLCSLSLDVCLIYCIYSPCDLHCGNSIFYFNGEINLFYVPIEFMVPFVVYHLIYCLLKNIT